MRPGGKSGAWVLSAKKLLTNGAKGPIIQLKFRRSVLWYGSLRHSQQHDDGYDAHVPHVHDDVRPKIQSAMFQSRLNQFFSLFRPGKHGFPGLLFLPPAGESFNGS